MKKTESRIKEKLKKINLAYDLSDNNPIMITPYMASSMNI